MLKRLCGVMLLALVAAAVAILSWSAGAQEEKPVPKAVDLGGEWSPERKDVAAPSSFRGCLVNRTYSPVTLTIVRPSFATIHNLPPGGHYRLWLYKGEAVFVAGASVGNSIMAFEKHDVAGETTVYIQPTKLTFARGVEECLKHAEKKGEEK